MLGGLRNRPGGGPGAGRADLRRRRARPARARRARRDLRRARDALRAGCSARSPNGPVRRPEASDFQRELIAEDAVRRAAWRSWLNRPRRRASCAPRPVSSPSWDRFDRSSAARFTRALRDWAADGPRRRTRTRSRPSTAPTATDSKQAGLAGRGAVRWRALDALRSGPPQQTPGADARSSSTASTTSTASSSTRSRRCRALRRRRHGLAALRARPARLQGGQRRPPGAARDGSRGAGARAADDHYADESRTALHHLERLPVRGRARPARRPGKRDPFHSSGGERAEVELAAARVLQLLRDGVEPGDVAVVFRDPIATRRCSSRSSAPTGSRTRSIARLRSVTRASAAACSR